jgi:hypothetical protein
MDCPVEEVGMDDSDGKTWRGRWLAGLLPLALAVCVVAVLWWVSQPEQRRAAVTPAWDLFTAIDRDDLAAVRRALDEGTPVDVREHGATPLIRAAAAGRVRIVELLLSRDADLRASDMVGTALAHAAFNGRGAETVRLLLRHGADPNLGGRRTPLMLATIAGDMESMRALIAAGAALDVRDNHGQTALDAARDMQLADAERLLVAAALTREADMRVGSTDGATVHFQPLELQRTASGS